MLSYVKHTLMNVPLLNPRTTLNYHPCSRRKEAKAMRE